MLHIEDIAAIIVLGSLAGGMIWLFLLSWWDAR